MNSGAAVIRNRKDWMQASASQLGRCEAGACCDAARSWLVAMGRSMDFSATDAYQRSAPRWLTHRYDWGPTQWPITWCAAVRSESIDCGVFSAFAREIFSAKGLEAYPGQVLRVYAAESNAHWRQKWDRLPGAFNWIGDEVVYHEVVVIRVGEQEARVYDSTDGIWLDPEIGNGHMGHLAIRAEIPIALRWGEHVLVNGQWTELGHAQ